MWLFVIFLAIPVIEIALFIEIGGWLTLWPTLGIVVGTAIIGTWLVRRQGRQVLRDLPRALGEMRDPLSPLAHGAMILLAGAFLVTPGFFTDAMGFVLLVPAVRRWAIRAIKARMVVSKPAARPAASSVIDGDYVDVTPEPAGTRTPSGWTKD